MSWTSAPGQINRIWDHDMNDFEGKNRLLLIAYIGETEPVPYALLVTLILSSLSMDYFAFQDALEGVLEAGLVTTDGESGSDAHGQPRITYRLSESGRQVLDSLGSQLSQAERNWLRQHAPDYIRQFYENSLAGAAYRMVEDGFMVSLGQAKDGSSVQVVFSVPDEASAKKAVSRFRHRADGISKYIRRVLLEDQ